MAPRPQGPTPTPTSSISTSSSQTSITSPTGTPPQRPSDLHNPNNPNYNDSTINTGAEAGIGVAIVIVLIILVLVGYYLYTRYRARKQGVPPPSINPFADSNRIGGQSGGGFTGWVREKFASAQRGRQAGGAYEGTGFGGSAGGGGGAAGGRWRHGGAGGALDPDEAWDARVGNEAVYDEHELDEFHGQHGQSSRDPRAGGIDTAYAGAGRGDPRVQHHDDDEDDDDRRYSYEQGDDLSMIEGNQHRAPRTAVQNPFEDPDNHRKAGGAGGDSPTEKKSVFKEVV